MPRCSLDQLVAFSAVAKHGSFSKAARAIGKDRATLHHQIGDLEIDWGIPLFDRSARLPRITEEGESLLRQAKHILYQIESMELSCDHSLRGIESELTLCHDASIPAEIIRKLEQQVYLHFPHVRLHWLHRNRHEALQELSTGEANLAITQHSGKVLPSKGVKYLNLGYLSFAFYAFADSTLANKESITMADLEIERQYISENFADTDFGKNLTISFQANRVSNNDILLALLKNGGYALLPCHIMETAPYQGQYKKLDIDIMNQDGKIAYVLLYRTQVKQSELSTFIINQISTLFSDID